MAAEALPSLSWSFISPTYFGFEWSIAGHATIQWRALHMNILPRATSTIFWNGERFHGTGLLKAPGIKESFRIKDIEKVHKSFQFQIFKLNNDFIKLNAN